MLAIRLTFESDERPAKSEAIRRNEAWFSRPVRLGDRIISDRIINSINSIVYVFCDSLACWRIATSAISNDLKFFDTKEEEEIVMN